MKIVVCVNHVPDTETKVKVGADGKSIDAAGVNFMLNPYDEIGVEEGLRTKQALGGEVTVVSCGGDANKETLRKALAMGCDKAVLLKDDTVRDSFAVAHALAAYVKESGAEIVFCGKQSIDHDNAQIGGLLAEMLGWSSVSVAVKMEIKDGVVIAEREIEGGHEIDHAKLPAVISAQKGLNEPRYPSLKGIMDAKRKPIDEKPAAAAESRVEVSALRTPPAKAAGRIVGTDAAAAAELVKLLHEEAKAI
jgi:electron transfer flavoprotein beta subunit